jgi:hypothetical protein
MITLWRILATVPVFLLATACGSDARDSATPPKTTTSTSPTTTTMATTTTTTAPAPPAAPLPAADGTDLAACADGTCEVSVRTGDIVTTPVGPLTTVVGEGYAGVEPDPASGMSGTLAGPTGWVGILNGQMFTVGAVQGDQAVLTFKPQ